MKRLQKIRLINWHRFTNETIEFGDATLLSGENGAGKSTILDAIQFVITCSKANFNKAAQEKGKRTLNTYIRCKTGREDRPYERTGEISAHVCLEFYDEAKRHPFLIGVVMDSASEEKEPNTAWYLMEKRELSDDLFFQGKMIKSISKFRSTNRGIRQFCPTIREARKMILNRFGRLDEKFFTLIPKALAFKPITDIKDFVYSYVLDEKEVNIDALRENVRSYQDLQRTLADVKQRISELEKIREKYERVEYHIRLDRDQEYYIERAQQDIYRETVRESEEELQRATLEVDRLNRMKIDLEKQIQEKNHLLENLRAELAGNEEYQALRELEKERDTIKIQLEKDTAEVAGLTGHIRKALRQTDAILKDLSSKSTANEQTQKTKESNPQKEHDKSADDSEDMTIIRAYHDALAGINEYENLADIRLMADQVIDWKEKRQQELRHEEYKIESKLDEEKRTAEELNVQIRELEAKRLIYPKNVIKLKTAIESQFRKSGRKSEVHILCEMLEITDPKWQNAVEGYLNTQRFHLLTDPTDFDLALSVYEHLRKKERLQGVGLINSGKLEQYDDAPEGSLAEVVKGKSKYARYYINMVLGKVHRCVSYQELKMYPVSITKECMRYQNHVASAINPKIFETPYIGAEAYKIQLAKKKQEAEELQAEIAKDKQKMKDLERQQKPLASTEDVRIRYEMRSLEELRTHRSALDDCEAEIKNLKAHSDFLEKQMRIESLGREQDALDKKRTDTVMQIGHVQGGKESVSVKIRETKELLKAQDAHIEELKAAIGEEAEHVEAEYLQRREHTKAKDLEQFKQNFENNRKGNLTRKAQAEDEMASLMRKYKTDHDFGAADSLAGYPDFAAEYDRLKNSRLLEYEEKVDKARESAEEEFREQFLSRLQENIKAAQKEFRELNKSLSEIHFGHENYEFLYHASRSQKKYYDMIMDDFNIMEGESIFSGIFEQNHREVIEELFEKLSLDDEDSAKTLQEYTDYRTYMDYDLKITSDDGSYMLYSKVSREKSGGETQTPFYITIAASFMQMYGNSIGGDSVGIVMMDEAFNNMDDERMSGVLSFMKHSNLQLIIAAPPDKIQYIGPAMDKIQLIMQDGNASYAEDFTVVRKEA